jgi:MFS family permease
MSTHVIASPPSGLARLRASRWAALPVVLAGTFMVVLDFFIVNVAMPAMQADLHASTGAIEWVVAGYGLTFATLLITAGRLGDRFGRRRMFTLGLGLFTLASAVCGLAWSPAALVAARLAQGVAAALLSPQVLSIIGVAYTGEDRVRALSVYGIVLGLAAVGGQLVGGVLVQSDLAGLGWRTCFLINVPVGLAALALAPRLVGESHAGGSSRIDVAGTVLVTAGLTAIVLPLVEGRQHGWPLWTWLALGAAPVLLGAFALHQRRLGRRGGAPLLDPVLFRERAFSAGLLTQLVFWAGQASFFLVLALYLQLGRGLDALQAGHALLALSVADVGTTGPVGLLAPALLLVGAGMGLVITPLTSTVLASLEPQRAGAASGALSTMQQVGNAIGVAVTGVVFFGALDRGFATAFELSLAQLAVLCVAVAALTRLLPRPAAAS